MTELHPEVEGAARLAAQRGGDAPPELQRKADALLETARRRVTAAGGAFSTLSVPAPRTSASLVSALGSTSFVWQPTERDAWVGIDEARRYRAQGRARFAQIRDQVTRDLAGSSDSTLRVFGGFAFAEAPHAPRWQEFGDALFVLPRFTYQQRDEGCTLTLALSRAELAEREVASQHVKELLRLEARLSELSSCAGKALDPSATHELSHAGWAGLIAEVLSLIGSGEATKIVAARRAELEFDAPVDVPATLEALRQHATGSTCFALRLGDTAFLGATPERLIQKRGLSLESEALAGTFRTTGSALAEELRRSPKEHREHLPVLDAIVEALGPLCSALEHPKEPEMRELPDLLHLRTPISATLASPVHVLDLVERLHPTPAVGGVPREAALSWIRERENAERGWYAGPIGWFDGNGDGDFQVALRSGLVRGNSATLYAGGGIVRGSEAESEYAETELKLRALRRALRF